MMLTTTRPRRWLADAYFGPGPVVAAVLIGVAAVAWAWPSLHGHLAFPDVVAGYVALADADKGIDLRAAVVLAATVVAASVGIGRAFRRVAPLGPASAVGVALGQALLLALAPAVWRLTISFVHVLPQRVPMFRLVALFPLGVWLAAAALGRYPRGSVRRSDVVACAGGVILSGLFAAFAAVALFVTPQRLIRRSAVTVFVAKAAPVGIPALAAVAIAAAVVIWVTAPDVERFRRRLLRLLVVCQLPTPLLLFGLVPPPLFDLSHQFANPYPWVLVAALGVMAAAGMWTVARRLVGRRPAGTLRRAVAPAAVIAMSIYCHGGVADLPRAERDYFHVGEQVLPWQQLWQFHTVPYADFVPIHGLMAYLRGGMNQLFFDGTIANYSAVDVLMSALAAGLITAAACGVVGPVAALILVPHAILWLDRIYLLPTGLFLVATPAFWRRPTRGLVLWLIVCAVEVAYNASIGPAFVVATTPVAVWAATRAGWRRSAAVAGGLAVVVLAGAAVPDVRLIVGGFVRFVIDNGWTNTLAHGIPWAAGAGQRDVTTTFGVSQASWELFRLSWMAVVVLAAGLAWRAMAVRTGTVAGRPGRRGLVPLAVATAVVLIVTFPWTMGRIGQGGFSRPGEMSGVFVCAVLPVLLLLAVPARRPGAAVLVATLLGALIQIGDSTAGDPGQILAKVPSVRVIPATARMIDGPKLGLPGVGQVLPPDGPDWFADVIDLRRGLDKLLRPGETFLDLTEQQALYFYLGLRVPVRYAPYVAANSRLQIGEERQLAAEDVPAVMFGPAAWFDGMPASLRCYRLWRDYGLRYVPVRMGSFAFLVEPRRAAAYNGTPPPPPGVRPPATEAELQLLDGMMRPNDLQRLPVAWGRSWKTLRGEFQLAGQGTVTPPTAADRWATATVPTATVPDGAAADFVLLHVSLTPSHPAVYRAALTAEPLPADVPTAAEPEMVLQWADVSGVWPAAAAHFKAHDGDLLVPLGVFPRWLLGRGSPAIRACVLNTGSVTSWRLDAVTYLKLR